MSSSFTWRATDAAGRAVTDVVSQSFPTQHDAEMWLADSWQDLADFGAVAVTLLEGDTPIYGPMSLAAQ